MRDFYLCYPAILTNTLVPQLGLSSILQNQLGVALDALTDSTASDPTTRSPNYHYETGKIENLSRANLCLAHGPLELDDDDLVLLKMDHLS